MSDTSHGNSYLQVESFGDDGVAAYTLLAHGQDERALNGGPGLCIRRTGVGSDAEPDPVVRIV
ncbi:MAG: hypothetical protein ACK5HY_17360 [Parahaliea sp.]